MFVDYEYTSGDDSTKTISDLLANLMQDVIIGKGAVRVTQIKVHVTPTATGGQFAMTLHTSTEYLGSMSDIWFYQSAFKNIANGATVGNTFSTTLAFPLGGSQQIQPVCSKHLAVSLSAKFSASFTGMVQFQITYDCEYVISRFKGFQGAAKTLKKT